MSKKMRAWVCGRLIDAPEGDYYVTCSFDPNHVILRSRMPYHIVKCVKNHPNHNKRQCPYDATEYIDNSEYENHLLTCESRRSTVEDKYETARLMAAGKLCNLQQTPFFHEHAPLVDEDWGGSLPASYLNDENDFNEDLFNDVRPVGRGIRRRPKKGVGRAEMLQKIFESSKRNNDSQSTASRSNQSTISNDSASALGKGISVGQFDDSE